MGLIWSPLFVKLQYKNHKWNLNYKNIEIYFLKFWFSILSVFTFFDIRSNSVVGTHDKRVTYYTPSLQSVDAVTFLTAAVPMAVSQLPGGGQLLQEVLTAFSDMGIRNKPLKDILGSVTSEGGQIRCSYALHA